MADFISLSATKIDDRQNVELRKNLISSIYNARNRPAIKPFDEPGILSLWIEAYVDFMPELLEQHNIKIRKFKDYCRSCIISEEEVYEIAAELFDVYSDLVQNSEGFEEEGELNARLPFSELQHAERYLFKEWIYLLPVALKDAGFELFRPAEEDMITVELAEELARIIHSRFKQHMIEGAESEAFSGLYLASENREIYEKEFDDLPEDIKLANIDNVFHIPTKLMSIGYKMERYEGAGIPDLLVLSDNEIESMAMMEHDRWSWERRLNGWIYDPKRNNELKHHDCLLPYADLPPHEQEKDRVMVGFIPSLLLDIAYAAVSISPDLQEDIAYINRHKGFVYEATTQVRKIRSSLATLRNELQDLEERTRKSKKTAPEISKKLTEIHTALFEENGKSILDRAESAGSYLQELEHAFVSGYHLQKTFMPGSYELKEHFPDSFVLLRPKDIVSGDFYFIQKVGDTVLFSTADCTGHGISGSILSGICYNQLLEATVRKQMNNPLEILKFIMPGIRMVMNHSSRLKKNKGEMELALCALDIKTGKLSVSSYGRPVYVFIEGEFVQLGKSRNATEHPAVHHATEEESEFITQIVTLSKGDLVYAFSDGLPDQIGGPKQKKYLTKRFVELLNDIKDKPMSEQSMLINDEVDNWRNCTGKYETGEKLKAVEQIDDISVIGVRV